MSDYASPSATFSSAFKLSNISARSKSDNLVAGNQQEALVNKS